VACLVLGAIVEDAPVQLDEVDVLEVAAGVPGVGCEEAVAHVDPERREKGGDQRRAGAVHSGDDDGGTGSVPRILE
jgi:hypothetical protein